MCNSSVSPHLCLNMPHTCVCQLSAKMGKKGFIRYRAREHLDLEKGPEGCQLFKVKLVVSRQDLYLEPLPVLFIPGDSKELVDSPLPFSFHKLDLERTNSWPLRGVITLLRDLGVRGSPSALPNSYLAR